MIYLGTHVRDDGGESHEFYCDGYLYYHSLGFLFLGPYGKKKIGYVDAYIDCDAFEYELPDDLNYIKYENFDDRISLLCNIVDKRIFENI